MKQKAIQDYYDLCEILDDNMAILASLIYMQGCDTSTIKKIITDLESLRVEKYATELDAILDLRMSTLRDIHALSLLAKLNNKEIIK